MQVTVLPCLVVHNYHNTRWIQNYICCGGGFFNISVYACTKTAFKIIQFCIVNLYIINDYVISLLITLEKF